MIRLIWDGLWAIYDTYYLFVYWHRGDPAWPLFLIFGLVMIRWTIQDVGRIQDRRRKEVPN